MNGPSGQSGGTTRPFTPGAPPEREVRSGKDNSLQIWVLDPDNNPIEFHEYTPESNQLKD